MKRPPPISQSDPHVLYDSCVNNTASPSMYIVFERDQCYPQYLITFILEGERIGSVSPIYGSSFLANNTQQRLLQQHAILSIAQKKRLNPLTVRLPKPKFNRRSTADGDKDKETPKSDPGSCVIS